MNLTRRYIRLMTNYTRFDLTLDLQISKIESTDDISQIYIHYKLTFGKRKIINLTNIDELTSYIYKSELIRYPQIISIYIKRSTESPINS